MILLLALAAVFAALGVAGLSGGTFAVAWAIAGATGAAGCLLVALRRAQTGRRVLTAGAVGTIVATLLADARGDLAFVLIVNGILAVSLVAISALAGAGARAGRPPATTTTR